MLMCIPQVSGFTVSRIKFAVTSKLGCRKLCIQWNNIREFVQVEICAGHPRKLSIAGWDKYQVSHVWHVYPLPPMITVRALCHLKMLFVYAQLQHLVFIVSCFFIYFLQVLTLLSGDEVPQPVIVQLLDKAENPCALPNILLELHRDKSVGVWIF